MKYVYEFTNKRKLTKREFIHWFEKKFLYTIRKFNLIQKNDVVGYVVENDFKDSYQNSVLEFLLKMFTEKSFVKLVKLPSTKAIDKKAICSTTDSEAERFVKILINGKIRNLNDFAPINKKIIKPLYLFLDKEVLLYAILKNLKFDKKHIIRLSKSQTKEVLLYAKLKNLKFRDEVQDKDKILKLINNLEKKHPEIKHSIINGYLKLEK